VAKILYLNEKRVQIVEAKNIGFIKAVRDVISGGGELEGIEILIEEAFNEAKKKAPEGYEVIKSDIKIISETNVLIVLTLEK